MEAKGGMVDEQTVTDILQQVMQGFQMMVNLSHKVGSA
jgi:hypothetical protein